MIFVKTQPDEIAIQHIYMVGECNKNKMFDNIRASLLGNIGPTNKVIVNYELILYFFFILISYLSLFVRI